MTLRKVGVLKLETHLGYQLCTNVALDKKFGISTVVTFQGWANIAKSMSIKTPFSTKSQLCTVSFFSWCS